jgi:hypothetical protein
MRTLGATLFSIGLLASPVALAEFGEATLVKHPGFILQEGPAKAKGAIVWSPGYDTRTGRHPQAATGEMPHFLDWLYGHGWDVYYVERTGGFAFTDRPRHAAAIRNAAAGLKGAGYKNIILGGQSSGGTYSMLAAEQDLGLFAILLSGSGPSISEGSASFTTMLQQAKARRIAVIHFAKDGTIGQRPKAVVASTLSAKRIPALNVHEPAGIEGHGGAFLSTFARRFGDCILRFLEPSRSPTGSECDGQ